MRRCAYVAEVRDVVASESAGRYGLMDGASCLASGGEPSSRAPCWVCLPLGACNLRKLMDEIVTCTITFQLPLSLGGLLGVAGRFLAMGSPIVEAWLKNAVLSNRGASACLTMIPGNRLTRNDVLNNGACIIPILRYL